MNKTCLRIVIVTVFLVHYVLAQGELLCAARTSVRRLDLRTNIYNTILTNLQRAVAVDYHYKKDLIIWSDVTAEKIYSSPLSSDGPKTMLVDVCVTPDGLAIDWVHDNLYWTDTGKNVIAVSRLDGSFIHTLFNFQVDEPRAIVLDPSEALMFWTDWGRRPMIEKASMDGSDRKMIVSTGIGWPNGLAIDLPLKTLYWADGKTHVLSSSDYEGKNVRTLINDITIMKHPFALDILGDFLYWSEWSARQESLYKANKNTGLGITKVVSGSDWRSLMGIRVYDESKQIPGTNRCGYDNGGCTHLCLPSSSRFATGYYTCVCPDGHLTSDNCSTIPMRMTSNSDAMSMALGNSTNERHNQENRTKGAVPSGAIIGILLALLGVALISYFAQKRFSNRGGQAALKSEGWTGLDNPVYITTTEDQTSFAKPSSV